MRSSHDTNKLTVTDTITDRNDVNLTETEDIKKRWQEYREELHKKDLHDPDIHDGMITHLESDILEHGVKWVYIFFSPLLLASLLFTAICKASSDSHFAFLHFS